MSNTQFSRFLDIPGTPTLRAGFPGTSTLRVEFLVLLSLSILLLSAPLARAQDDGDSGWNKVKSKPAEKTPAKPAAQPASKPAPKTSPDKTSLKDQARELFGKPNSGASPANSDSADARGWAVVIAAFRGEDRDAAAAKALSQVRSEGGLPEAFAAHRRDATIIAVGDFPAPDDQRARDELARIQQLEINGNKPFKSAMLAPPLDFKMAGSMPQYNLVKAKQLFGEQAIYTLQVAVYGRLELDRPAEKDLTEARAAAEQAVAKLREEGEQAWYYHGPSMSMVCIGTFDQTDFDPQLPNFKSPKLRETQKRHPYNLYNGAGLKVKRKGERSQTLQPSSLVEIPKN